MSLEREPTRRSGRRRSRRRRTGQIINSNHSDGDGTTWNHPVPRPILVLVSVLLPLLLGTASCSSISPDIRHRRRRRRQQGISIGSGTSLTTCTQNLLQADSNPRDESISQIEFVSFVASTLLDASDDPSCGDPAGSGGCVLYLDSDGTTLWNGSYQTPVTSFGLLPPDLVGLFNRFACGNANYGCLNGIDVSGAAREENGEGTLTDQEQAVLFRFCAGVEEAAEELGRGEGGGGGTGSTAMVGATTTTSSLPACPTKGHVPDAAYQAGDLVVGPLDEDDSETPPPRFYYRCRDFPYTAWCSQEVYAPGAGTNWDLAWTLMGECRVEEEEEGQEGNEVTTPATTAAAIMTTTTSITSHTTTNTDSTFGTLEKSTTAATAESASTTDATEMVTAATTTTTTVASIPNPDDPPYTGNLPVRFQYVLANTIGFAARTIPEGVESMLLTETTNLVERVITDAFGGFQNGVGDGGAAAEESDVFATMEATDLDIDDDDERDNDERDNDGGTARARIIGGVPHDGGVRRQLRGTSPSAPTDRRHRKLQVLYEPGSVAIVELRDIDCPGPSADSSSVLCQKVYCAVDLLLFDEPPQATELRFQQSLSRAIADGGIALPPETGVTVTSSESALVLLPEATAPDPGNDDDRDDDDDENDDAASWRLPVIITGAVAAALLALPCFGFLLLRKRRTRTRTRTRNGKPKEAGRRVVTPKEASLENDVFRANLIPVDEYPPPRDVERGVDPFGPSSVANDDIHNPHPISAEKKPNPFIDEEDDNISSYSDGSSSGSSTGSSASSSSSSSSNNSSTSIESDYTESSSDSSRESSSTEDIHQNTAVQWTGVSNQDAEPTTPQANNASAAADTPRRLPTVEEMPDEDMSKSAMSSYMNLSSSTCDLSMYRAGVEALVKEACPDQMYRIEDMMVEYQGREQLLIGELSTMLAAKQRELDGDDDDDYDDDDDDSQGLASNSDEWSLNENESSRESNSRRSGKMDSTLSDSDMVGSDGKSLVNSGMTMDDENVYNSGGDSSTKNDADVSNSEVGEAPKSELSQSSVGEGNAGTVAVGVAAGGAMAGAGALLASQASGKGSMEDIDRIETSFDDSDSETSGWSSNSDGLSSMNSTSFETSESSIFEMTRASSLAAIAKASKMTEGLTSRLSDPTDPKVISRAARDDSSSPNGTGTGRSDEGSDHSSKLSEQKVSRKDLDDAIEAGDWQAVGATAALLAHAEVEDTDSIASHRSYSSRESDLSSMEIHRASEIEKLVQEGDWEGIIQAATKYDGTSDAGERVSNVSTISSNFRGSDLSRDISDIRTEVEELVCRVVPDEIDNVDEMMLQFQGREDELVETLKTMEERMSPAKTDTNMTSNPRGERRTSPKSDSEGGNSFGASTEDLFSSPCEIFEGESAVGSIETPQGSVYSSHEKRSSEESTSTSSEIGDIVLDSGSEEEYAGRN